MNALINEEQELQEALVEVRKRKLRKKVILISAIAVVVLAFFIGIYAYGYNVAQNKSEAQIAELNQQIDALVNTPVVLEPVTPEIVKNVLSEKTEEISELATAEYIFTNAARFTDTAHIAKVFDWMTKKSFVQKWDGTIKAGVELNELQVSVADNVITITMPNAEILSYEVDYNSVEVLDEKNNVFNPISISDKSKFDLETKDAMIERAKGNGLLEKASENAQRTVLELLALSIDNIEDYEVNFVIAKS